MVAMSNLKAVLKEESEEKWKVYVVSSNVTLEEDTLIRKMSEDSGASVSVIVRGLIRLGLKEVVKTTQRQTLLLSLTKLGNPENFDDEVNSKLGRILSQK